MIYTTLNTLLRDNYNNNATVRFLSILKTNLQHQYNLRQCCFSTVSTTTSTTNTADTTTTGSTTSNSIDKTNNNNNNNKKSHRLSHHYRFHFKESWCVHDDLQEYVKSSFTGSTCHKNLQTQTQTQQHQQLETIDRIDSNVMNTTNNTNTTDTNITTNLDLTILGSGSGSCFFERNFSCTALRINNTNAKNNKVQEVTYLIDAGENVVNQFIRSTWDITSIQKIFITHLHGDHVMGLPGLITFLERYEYDKYYSTTITSSNNNININNNNETKKKKKRRPLEIYGPVGLYNFITMNLTYNHTIINFLNIIVYELYGGSKLSSKYDICTKTFPEWNVSNVRRKRLLPNFKPTATATTTITTKNQQSEEQSEENIMSSSSSENDSSGTTTTSSDSNMNTNHIVWKLCEQNNIVESDNNNDDYDNTTKTVEEMTMMKQTTTTSSMYVTAAEVNHVPTMQCFGFVFHLVDNNTITKTKTIPIATSSTVTDITCSIPTVSNIYKAVMGIKNNAYNDGSLGLSNDSNNTVVTTTQQHRKVSFIGDCYYVPPSMRHIINNSNVLIHEATLSARNTSTITNDDTTTNNTNSKSNKSSIPKKYKGHSSAQTAASVANECIPQILLLNHLNSTASKQSTSQRIVQEATNVISNTITRVQLSYDFLQLSIPYNGYSFFNTKKEDNKQQPKNDKEKIGIQ